MPVRVPATDDATPVDRRRRQRIISGLFVAYALALFVAVVLLPKALATRASANGVPAQVDEAVSRIDVNSLPVEAFYDAAFVFSVPADHSSDDTGRPRR